MAANLVFAALPPDLAAAPPAVERPAESLLIARGDGSPGAPVSNPGHFTRSAYVVTPNVLGVARHAHRVFVPAIGGAPRLEFPVLTFEPREGFSIDADGNLIVDDNPRKVGTVAMDAVTST